MSFIKGQQLYRATILLLSDRAGLTAGPTLAEQTDARTQNSRRRQSRKSGKRRWHFSLAGLFDLAGKSSVPLVILWQLRLFLRYARTDTDPLIPSVESYSQ